MFELYPALSAMIGTGFTFLMTALGASIVFFFRKGSSPKTQKLMLGFAAGVMIAASVWSLIIPAMESAEELGIIPWIPAACGFALGGVFFSILEKFLPFIDKKRAKDGRNHTSMFMLAITLHNLPEGMAVGLAFFMAASGGDSPVTTASAIALALGIGIQNLPEGAAISLPLLQEGKSHTKAFLIGSATGLAEPIGGIVTALLVGTVTYLLPWFLSFAAGAMVYVVADELIPQAYEDGSKRGVLGVMAGFLIMMVLDVALS